jgi:mycothiol synthase
VRRRAERGGYRAGMAQVERLPSLEGAQVAAVKRLLAAAAAEDDHTPIDPASVNQPEGSTFVLGHTAGRLAGFARIDKVRDGWQVAYALDPAARVPGSDVAAGMLAEARRVVAEGGGGRLQLWADRPTAPVERLLRGAGLQAERSLYQMRRPLPLEPAAGDGIETRPFVPGRDEAAWVEVNNRAFAWHPEQGGWSVADVEAREAEAWFDPAGFLLHEEDGRLVGFCWTKVHAAHEPPLGEIYVIAVDPDAGRRGLGRRLVVAGLDHLASTGLKVGILYCDASNVAAVKLYVDLGFEVDHIDRVYAATVPAGSV